MRIVVFVVDDVEFVPDLLDNLFEEFGDSVVQAYVSKTLFSFKKLRRKLPFLIKNRYPFCIRILDLSRYLLWRLKLSIFGKADNRNIFDYFKRKGVSVEYIQSINEESSRKMLEELDADVFLFAPFDQIAKSDFIDIPKMGVYNIHLGKLPDYRGGLSAFWVLRFGDPVAGASMHRVVEEIDAGEIVAEVTLDVETSSMKQLMSDTVQSASEMLVEGVRRIEEDVNYKVDVSDRSNRYFLYPELNDFREFYRSGNRLI